MWLTWLYCITKGESANWEGRTWLLCNTELYCQSKWFCIKSLVSLLMKLSCFGREWCCICCLKRGVMHFS
jgi:hypothetical protein